MPAVQLGPGFDPFWWVTALLAAACTTPAASSGAAAAQPAPCCSRQEVAGEVAVQVTPFLKSVLSLVPPVLVELLPTSLRCCPAVLRVL